MNRADFEALSREQLIELVQRQAELIEQLSKRVAELEAKLGLPRKPPENSGVPPSQGHKPSGGGGKMTVAGTGARKRYYCANHKEKGAAVCRGVPGIADAEALALALNGLRTQLMQPAAYEKFRADFARHVQAQGRDLAADQKFRLAELRELEGAEGKPRPRGGPGPGLGRIAARPGGGREEDRCPERQDRVEPATADRDAGRPAGALSPAHRRPGGDAQQGGDRRAGSR